MARVTIALALLSTVVVITTFAKGIGALRGGDVTALMQWAIATLLTVLAANVVVIMHAVQTERLIRGLRRQSETPETQGQESTGLEDRSLL